MVIRFLILLLLIVDGTVIAKEINPPQIKLTPQEQLFIEQNPVIIVGGEEDWPPFDYVENGRHTGLASDHLNLLSKYTGLTFQVRTGMKWHELLAGLQNKELDLLPMIYWSPERDKTLNFTETYLNIRQYIFTHKEDNTINSMQDLFGKTLAVPKGYAQIELIKSKYPAITIYEVANPLAAIDAVITHKAEGLIENTALIDYLKKQNNISGIKPAFATNIGIDNIHMATRKDWPILRDIIQKGLEKITHNEYRKITAKWMGISTDHNPLNKRVPSITLSKQQQDYLNKKGTIKACVDPDWMPIEKFEQGEYTGIGSDYLKLLQQKIITPIQIVPTKNRDESLSKAENRECDIFLLSMDVAPQKSFMDITTPHLSLPVVLATKPDVLFISGFNHIADKKVGILEGCALANTIKIANPNVNFINVPSRKAGLDMVSNNQLFAFVENMYSLGHEIQNNYYGELKIGGNLGVKWDLGIATRNDEPLLHEIFEQAADTLTQEDKQKIVSNWSTVQYIEAFDYGLLWKIVFGFSLLLLALFIRHRSVLNHQTEIDFKNQELAQINSLLKMQKAEVQHHADHDFLTQLPNRKKISEILEHAITIADKEKRQLAVLFLDLDRFKNINDNFGHTVGDEVLIQTAKRLKERLRNSDTVARIGGDEFLIMVETNRNIQDIDKLTRSIINKIQTPLYINDIQHINSVSIGISIYPGDGEDASTLIKHADNAMYHAKQQGKNNYFYYTKELSEQTQRRYTIEQALLVAIKKEQLTLVFQPQIELETLNIVGVEALVRWHHPELGFISPAEFIPVAEETGLIVEIGEWIFRQSCQTFSNWKKAGLHLDSLAINVSSVQFNQPNITHTFSQIIDSFDIPAHEIEIEITERYIMADTEQNNSILQSLRESGFRISVDDFGTGYSSMSYLKTLPLDIIKIDKSFIDEIPHDNNDLQITKAILALSHSLGYTVIAEGIEKQEQLETLRYMSCDIGQGYYFNKPLPADELLAIYHPSSIQDKIAGNETNHPNLSLPSR